METIDVTIDDELKELIPGYLANRRKDIESILKSIETEDFENIRITGHSMKGTGAGYGFEQISEIGKEIEDGAKERKAEIIKIKTDELSDYLERVRITYE